MIETRHGRFEVVAVAVDIETGCIELVLLEVEE